MDRMQNKRPLKRCGQDLIRRIKAGFARLSTKTPIEMINEKNKDKSGEKLEYPPLKTLLIERIRVV
ncbi:hypothetical protein FM107_16660 [Sphingobacterium sp. JB170]|nr:hypothetical protein FM107_16660 [Sphingobacterium sp. JB170]